MQTCKDQGLFGKGLTFYETLPGFTDPEKEGFQKHSRKRRKCWQPFSPFPTMISTLPQANISSVTFNVSSANAFNLDQSNIY